MLVRKRFEKEYAELFEETGYGSTIWSPLASGVLTGKYNSGEFGEGTRAKSKPQFVERYFGKGKKEKTLVTLNNLDKIAKELGCSMAQMALAWTLNNNDVSVAMFGPSKLS